MSAMDKIKIGVSACLLGEKVRYDGGHQHDRYVTDTLGRFFEFVPVCPEVEYGLPVPREAMHLAGDPANPRLVTIRTGVDHTEGMRQWAANRLKELENEALCGFIFKSRSPSSGMQAVKVYTDTGMPNHRGVGIFAAAFIKHFPVLPVEDDGRLHDANLRENFIERVFVFQRWQELIGKGASSADLVNFQRDHKLLFLSHSPKHASLLGKLAAGARVYAGKLTDEYAEVMMEGLRLTATTKKHTNVLQHMAGYFKKVLSADEKEELLELIGNYHAGLVPLVVPLALIKHYVRKYDEPYLKQQLYLNPHPAELMLRNHV
jgi:uncharacterized protein YbgA (DUF1722 family)/uncharacterized protein YbbK (DUF523 family)